MDCGSGVEASDQEHDDSEADAAVYGAVATTPAIGPDEGRNSNAKDDQSRDSRGEK